MRLKQIKNVIFDEMTHSYICGDNLLLGVTSLMKKHGLSPDYGDVDPEVLRKAAEKGTAMHKLFEDYDNGKTVVETEELKVYKSFGLQVHCSEYLVSDGEMIASFIDKVLEDCSLADVKRTSQVHKKAVAWQLSIYAYLFEKMNPSKKVPHLYCIHVREDKGEVIELNRIPDEKVEALFLAEREGRIYEDEDDTPEAGVILQEDEVARLVNALDAIAQYKAAMKVEEERAAAIQDRLYKYMIANNLDEMKCESGRFIRRAESTRVSVDTAKLKADMPDVFEKYQKVTAVKGSVVFKANK